MYDVDEVLGATGAPAIAIVRRVRDVHANVILEQLRHQAVRRAAR
jgi:hypothetical protein